MLMAKKDDQRAQAAKAADAANSQAGMRWTDLSGVRKNQRLKRRQSENDSDLFALLTKRAYDPSKSVNDKGQEAKPEASKPRNVFGVDAAGHFDRARVKGASHPFQLLAGAAHAITILDPSSPPARSKANASRGLLADLDRTAFRGEKAETKRTGAGGGAVDILATPQRVGRGAGVPRPVELQTLVPYMPLDWNIKKSVVFRSSRSFDWCKVLRSQPNAAGIAQFTRCTRDDDFLEMLPDVCDMTQRNTAGRALAGLQRGLLCWVYAPPSGKMDDEASVSAWSKHFVSLMTMYKAGMCPFFIADAQAFMALFLSPGLCGSPGWQARISRSTPGLRKALHEKGVPYQMPFMKEKGDGHGPRSAAENSPYSMLVMTGFHDVQLLYDFVLETASTAMAPLYSPVAFAGASLTAAEITRVETVRMVSGGAGATHVLEVQGVLHPLMMYRMAQVLQVTQANDLVIAPQDSPGSTGLNAKLPAELSTNQTDIPDDTRRDAMGLSAGELEALQRCPVGHLLTLKDVTAAPEGYRYTLRTSRSSASLY